MIAPDSSIEEDVFIGPNLVVTNDQTVGRPAEGDALTGATLRRGCRIGASVTLLPGVEIGADALVAAGSLVTRSVLPGVTVMGSPARVVR